MFEVWILKENNSKFIREINTKLCYNKTYPYQQAKLLGNAVGIVEIICNGNEYLYTFDTEQEAWDCLNKKGKYGK